MDPYTTDAGSVSILILLDLFSAFDTISHSILISRLSALGIPGNALAWFTSFLSDRQHYITVRQAKSSTAPVSHGVPQGSVLGPLLFIIYMFPLGKIIRRHGFNFLLCYADDTQLYISFPRYHPFPTNSILACIDDI
ncbi:putative RNA-directed DNA polymerase from transposon BS [Labeo rohita]|uniref:RNA-directed DNA polymerase from transposon BS n=1 Tax=Labeo rohita TaxID=84645 RepID=A0ABQ8LBD4_LABRO|nr:putative RNA-directed DNA polymerase from transposon BS [Labeo rohita]